MTALKPRVFQFLSNPTHRYLPRKIIHVHINTYVIVCNSSIPKNGSNSNINWGLKKSLYIHTVIYYSAIKMKKKKKKTLLTEATTALNLKSIMLKENIHTKKEGTLCDSMHMTFQKMQNCGNWNQINGCQRQGKSEETDYRKGTREFSGWQKCF